MNTIVTHKPLNICRLHGWLMFFCLLLTCCYSGTRAIADTCLSAPKPLVFVMVRGVNGFDAEVADLLEDAIMGRLNQNGIRYTRIKELQTLLQQDVWRQLIGTAQDASLIQEVAGQLGTEWFYFIQLQGKRIVGTPRTIEARLQNNRTGETLRATSRELSLNEEEMMQTVFQVISEQSVNLDCDLRGGQIKPVVPSLRLTLSKESVLPGERFYSYASLRDLSDNSLLVGKDISHIHEPPSPGSRDTNFEPTDANGLSSILWQVNTYSAEKGAVQAKYGAATVSPKRYYRLVRPQGDLRAKSQRATLLPNQPETVQVTLTSNGRPAVGKTLNFGVRGGSLAVANAVTDANGQAEVAYTAPAQPAVTEVSVSTPVNLATPAAASLRLDPLAAEDLLQDSVSYVVDVGVAMKLNLADTLIDSPASISVDLDRDGAALTGVPVDFQLLGGGSLNATRASTDSAGRAETLFFAPQDAGASTITVSATVDGQSLTRNGSIRYTDARDSITREIQEVIRLMYANPSDTTLQRLLNLKNQLNTLGQTSRSEELLQSVSNPLNCVEQLTKDRCASGAGLSSAQSTLDLLKNITGNTGLNYLSDRVTETVRFCPYPAFMPSGSFYLPSGQVSYENGTHTFGVFFSISFNDDNQPRAFSFQFIKESDPYQGLFVRSAVFVSGSGTSFTGLIDNGGDTNLPGGRFGMLGYQSAATSPTVHINVDGKNVSGSFDLYKYQKDDVEYLAAASFNASLDFPSAPANNCGGRTPPVPGDD